MAADKDQTDNGIRVCLPDLMKPSKDCIMTSTGIQPDDTLARVPKNTRNKYVATPGLEG
jgi:hypothetical protein